MHSIDRCGSRPAFPPGPSSAGSARRLALCTAGLDALMRAGLAEERQRIGQAGIELAPGELLATATAPGARLEGVTARRHPGGLPRPA
ncbi:hypothetical protein AB0F11_30150 [Streptomyces sp. NPDC032472]|uniref:hypothetical protein n=1 Tax=Streptomyces sp. NPDC032472 TaxID=3155018 RepID=UPI0034113B58